MPADKRLFVKIRCSICKGKNPGCPYCDAEGKHYVEATVRRVTEWLGEQDDEDRKRYRKALEDI